MATLLLTDHPVAILALGWAGYFTLHSILASEGVKRAVRNAWPALFRGYRIVYNLLALILIVPLIRGALSGSEFLVPSGALGKGAAMLLLAVSGYVFYRVVREMDVPEFLGLAAERRDGGLRTGGMYAHVRHPLYFATILLFAGLLAWLPTPEMVVTSATAMGYLIIGSRLEERKLIARFGGAYLEYRSRVKSLIPYVF